MRLAVLIGLVAAAAVLAGCNTRGALYHPTLSPSWSASRGKKLIEYYGCGSCHVIGGIPGGNGHVGPPLTRIGSYHQIAGVLPNTPRNLVRWILDPPKFVPNVDMPKLGLSQQSAEDITAYLYNQ